MWKRVKVRMVWFALNVFITVLPYLAAIDGFVLNNWQKFIADPLQMRGVSLRMQMRGIYVRGAFMFLFQRPFSWWNFPIFFWWLVLGFFSDFSLLDDSPGQELAANPSRASVGAICVRCAVYWLCLIAVAGTNHFAGPLMVAAVVTVSCDAKPPRPKRLKRLVTSTEGA